MQTYRGFYAAQSVEPPTSSRLGLQTFSGIQCPEKVSFGRVHGTGPGTCDIDMTGLQQASAGSLQTIQIAGATFVGYVIGVQTSQTDEEGYTTHIKLVDARERLFGYTTACQLNMLDDIGRWYHILPSEWRYQAKRFLTSIDLTGSTEGGEEANCDGELWSAYTILNELGGSFDFSLSAPDSVISQLKKTKPLNVDWNNGIKVMEAIDQIVSYCGLQFTAWGNLNIHITRRGDVDDILTQMLLIGAGNICTLANATKSSTGTELNDRGNKAVLVGGRNKFEFCFKCNPCWAFGFDKLTVFQGSDFGKVLSDASLSLSSTMKQLFDATGNNDYRHKGNWKGRKIEDMTIQEYMDTFPFKVFAIDFLDSFFTDEDSPNDLPIQPDPNAIAGQYPIAESLVSDPNVRFLPKATIAIDDFKSKPPSRKEQRVYFTEGVELIVENDLRKSDDDEACEESWKAYLRFDSYRVNWKIEDVNNKANWKIDTVTCRLAVETGKYIYSSTGTDPAVRQRTTVKVDNDVFQSFIHPGVPYTGESRAASGDSLPPGLSGTGIMEVPMLAMAADPDSAYASIKLYAEDVARVVVADVVNADTVNTAGFVEFAAVAGFMPNGVVDNVAINFSAEEGASEVVNFTTDRNVPASLTDQRNRVFGVKGRAKYLENNSSDYVIKQLERTRREQAAAAKAGGAAAPQAQQAANLPVQIAGGLNAGNAVKVELIDGSGNVEVGQVVIVGAPESSFDYTLNYEPPQADE